MISKMRKTDNQGFTLIELMIVIAIIGILAAIAIPNFIAYRNKSFCTKAESDANNIASDVSSYFSIPTHTGITTTDVKFNPNDGNTFSVAATAPNTAITITVTDKSNRCPKDYRDANAVNTQGDGWNGFVYQKVIKQ